jgi:hypothetical protein
LEKIGNSWRNVQAEMENLDIEIPNPKTPPPKAKPKDGENADALMKEFAAKTKARADRDERERQTPKSPRNENPPFLENGPLGGGSEVFCFRIPGSILGKKKPHTNWGRR